MSQLREKFLKLRAEGKSLAALTAYDYPTARLLDEAGLDLLLVGDSLGMVILGMPDTVDVSLEQMLHHTGAVVRGASKTPVVADLPRCASGSVAAARSAAQKLAEAGAQAVKIEGGREVLPQIEAIVGEQIEVIGHLGMLPQRVREEGGYFVKGRTREAAIALREDAQQLEKAGVAAIVLELVEKDVARTISQSLIIPTIGIGSGSGCTGQILVTHDLLGLCPWFRPAFVQPRAHLAEEVLRAAREFAEQVHKLGVSKAWQCQSS